MFGMLRNEILLGMDRNISHAEKWIRNAGMIRSVMVYIRPGTLSRAVPELLVG